MGKKKEDGRSDSVTATLYVPEALKRLARRQYSARELAYELVCSAACLERWLEALEEAGFLESADGLRGSCLSRARWAKSYWLAECWGGTVRRGDD